MKYPEFVLGGRGGPEWLPIMQCGTGTRVSFLQRVNAANEWREILLSQVASMRYGDPFPNGNVVAVLTLW